MIMLLKSKIGLVLLFSFIAISIFPFVKGGYVQAEVIECVYTPGYWKNHEIWPVTALTLGDTSYDQAQLITMLKSNVRGDMEVILIKHLIAAKLNLELHNQQGTSLDCYTSAETWGLPIIEVVYLADDYLAGRDYHIPFSGGIEDLKDILDTFNNGPEGVCLTSCGGGGGAD